MREGGEKGNTIIAWNDSFGHQSSSVEKLRHANLTQWLVFFIRHLNERVVPAVSYELAG